MDALLKDGFGFVEFELGLEVLQVIGVPAAVGTAASIGEVELLVNYFLTSTTPVAFAAAILLGLLWVDAIEAVLTEELGQIILWKDGALGNASVVLVVELVRSSHVDGSWEELDVTICWEMDGVKLTSRRTIGCCSNEKMGWKREGGCVKSRLM